MPPLPRVVALVPAAGRGERFGGSVPKQFLSLGGQPVLAWAVGGLLEAGVWRVVVALPEDRLSWGRDTWGREARVACCSGGSTRQDSVERCLRIARAMGEEDGPFDLVLVHDGARPAVSPEDVRAVIAAAAAPSWDGAILGRPLHDTVKRVEAGLVVGTADRARLFRAETPQVFRRQVFERALEQAARDKFSGTDEASLVERLPGSRIAPVAARFPNPKLTEPNEAELLETILRGRRRPSAGTDRSDRPEAPGAEVTAGARDGGAQNGDPAA